MVKVEPFPALIGSDRPIDFDPQRFSAMLGDDHVKTRIRAAGFDPARLAANAAGAPRLWSPDTPRTGEVNTDLHPRDEFYLFRR